jgi:hypothetical protein
VAIHYSAGAGRLASHSVQRPSAPLCDCRRVPAPPSTTKDLNTCIEEEISNNEFQKPIVKMINDLKEETQNLVFEHKEDVNKQLNNLRENTKR